MNEDEMIREGYLHPRKLPNGEWVAICPFIYTWGLVVGIEGWGYRTRFCYPTFVSASDALEAWDGAGDPPGPWIKEKGQVERNNPNIGNIKGVPVVTE